MNDNPNMDDCPFKPYRYHYLLASRSERRRALLEMLGLPFTVVDTDGVEEVCPAGLSGRAVPSYLARLKSAAYPRPLLPRQVLVTADTVVAADGLVLGKPASREEALDMLRRLSDRTHEVHTGVCLRDAQHSDTFTDTTRVTFRAVSAEEAAFYVDRFKPYDKAGAYGIQEWIGYVAARRIEGSYYNVMGLPVEALYEHLNLFLDHEA